MDTNGAAHDSDPYGIADLPEEERARAEALISEMQDTRRRVASVPATDVIANHLMGLFELATIHLDQQPPSFGDAALAIDAFRAVYDRLQGRFGENEAVLVNALTNIQQAFVDLADRSGFDEAAAARD